MKVHKRRINYSGGHNQSSMIFVSVAVITCFFICWTPYHIQRLLSIIIDYLGIDNPIVKKVQYALQLIAGIILFFSCMISQYQQAVLK